MFQAEIHVHFDASAPHHPRGVWEWVRALGASSERTAELRQELGAHRLSVFKALVDTLDACGFQDAIHVFLGTRPVYTDPAGRDTDLADAVRQTLASSSIVAQSDDDLRLVCSRRHEGLHFLVDAVLRWDDDGELERAQLRLSARASELQIRKGDTAAEFANRVRGIVADRDALTRYLHTVDEVAALLAHALDVRLPAASVTTEPAIAELVRGGKRQIGRLRNLGFGSAVRPPTYRHAATHKRTGAYDRPFFYYHFDPYHDLMGWVAIEEILHSHAWASPRVRVLRPDGGVLFRGDDPDGFDARRLAVPDHAVSFDGAGGLEVSKDVPLESSLDPVEVGSPFVPGFGGNAGGG